MEEFRMKLINNLSDESVLAKCESLGFDDVQSEEILSHLRKYGLDLLPYVDTDMSPYKIGSVGHFMNLSKCIQYAEEERQDEIKE
jgi:hypothetical protein